MPRLDDYFSEAIDTQYDHPLLRYLTAVGRSLTSGRRRRMSSALAGPLAIRRQSCACTSSRNPGTRWTALASKTGTTNLTLP